MAPEHTAAVVIGRNEGEHLRHSLASVVPHVGHTVYVDSGSTDGSVELATQLGAQTIELNANIPFTAARARNEGWKYLIEQYGDTQYIQFVDGDCILDETWIDQAAEVLTKHPEAAIVCGHVREAQPDRNIYHRLAAMEWETPVGSTKYCGGIALIRASALGQIDGYRDELMAGEDPELCVRMRQAGWAVLKIDREMASHEIDTDTFAAFWRRCVRSGHAYTEGAALHGAPPERHWVRESRSITFWGLTVPLIALALAWPTRGVSLLVVCAAYFALFAKILRFRRRAYNDSYSSAALYAGMCVIAKWPNAIGQLQYWTRRWWQTPGDNGEFNVASPRNASSSNREHCEPTG
jgi:GT2 family glycosyltransferase